MELLLFIIMLGLLCGAPFVIVYLEAKKLELYRQKKAEQERQVELIKVICKVIIQPGIEALKHLPDSMRAALAAELDKNFNRASKFNQGKN